MGCDIVLAAEIDAEPETVYEAITTQKGEASFWTSDCDLEQTLGSEGRFGFPGAPVDARVRVDQLDPGRKVVWTNLGDFPFWKDTMITWDLEPRDGKTHVFFRHGNWSEEYPEHDFASVNWVWAQILGRLKGFAETGEPQPFFG